MFFWGHMPGLSWEWKVMGCSFTPMLPAEKLRYIRVFTKEGEEP
jgi:hypothetical protein